MENLKNPYYFSLYLYYMKKLFNIKVFLKIRAKIGGFCIDVNREV